MASPKEWSAFEISSADAMTSDIHHQEYVFSLPSQFPPFDEISGLDYGFPVQETVFDALPPMDFTTTDDLLYNNPYADLVSNINTPTNGGFLYEGPQGSELEQWNNEAVMDSFQNTENQLVQPKSLFCCKNKDGKSDEKVGGRLESGRAAAEGGLQKGCNINTKMLTREVISRHFYMRITQAAKELNVGLTFLKKKCREFGIKRWPHRKLNSLQALICNVQELWKQEAVENDNVKKAVQLLELEKKLIEEAPDTDMDKKTMKLRQTCFKANYKKRKTSNNINGIEGDKKKTMKMMAANENGSNHNYKSCVVDDQASSSTAALATTYDHYYLTWPGSENDMEIIKSSLFDSCTPPHPHPHPFY